MHMVVLVIIFKRVELTGFILKSDETNSITHVKIQEIVKYYLTLFQRQNHPNKSFSLD